MKLAAEQLHQPETAAKFLAREYCSGYARR